MKIDHFWMTLFFFVGWLVGSLQEGTQGRRGRREGVGFENLIFPLDC